MNRESKYNADRNSGTYRRPVHHGEVVKGAFIPNDAPSALNQNLAAPEGMSLAKRFLARRKDS